MRFHICYNFVNCPNFKRTVLAGAQLTTENLQLTNRFRELTEGGGSVSYTRFPSKTGPKFSFPHQKLPFFHKKNIQKLHQNSHFSSRNSHFSIKIGPKLVNFHQNSAIYPSKPWPKWLKNMGKHMKTPVKLSKKLEALEIRSSNFLGSSIMDFHFAAQDHPACLAKPWRF